MIATDVASRGLDVPTVATVVHYDVARAVGTFVHRAGRTAVSLDPYPVLQVFVDQEDTMELSDYSLRPLRRSNLNLWTYPPLAVRVS